jgi:hypothetical protein
MGLGALTKGPVALIVPAAVSLLYCASRGEWLRWARMVFNPLGWLLLVAIVAPWYIHAYARHGQDFIDGFILRHNVQRFSGSLEGHGGSAFYYVLAVPLLLLPWSGLFFMALGRLRGLQDPLQRFLWLWFAFVLGFFSLSGTKLPHYVLYGCTPLFVLAGLQAQWVRRAWPHLLAPMLLFVLFPLLPNIFDALARSTLGDGFYRAQLGRALEVADTRYIALTVGGLVVWGLSCCSPRAAARQAHRDGRAAGRPAGRGGRALRRRAGPGPGQGRRPEGPRAGRKRGVLALHHRAELQRLSPGRHPQGRPAARPAGPHPRRPPARRRQGRHRLPPGRRGAGENQAVNERSLAPALALITACSPPTGCG